jgi:hypothetical protein
MGRLAAKLAVIVILCNGCTGRDELLASSSFGSEGGATGDEAGSATTAETSPTEGGGSDSSNSDGSVKLDVGSAETGAADTNGQPSCEVVDDMDGIAPCVDRAPPDSFQPDVQWSWDGDGEYKYSVVTPLVANLTDDNGDGRIDLCDTPDIVLTVMALDTPGCCSHLPAYLYVFDGATGALHWKSPDDIPLESWAPTPALADVDEDGKIEIFANTDSGGLVAFANDGSVKWHRQEWAGDPGGSLAIANLDNDGPPEIFRGDTVFDSQGSEIFSGTEITLSFSATTAADLDGDDDLEIVGCRAAYHHDGTLAWTVDTAYGYPHVADFDADGEPEVMCSAIDGVWMIEADGTMQTVLATGQWGFPGVVHDLDGDGMPEFASGNGSQYVAREVDGTQLWAVPVTDPSGLAGGTAFDFLGDGVAEAMYADHFYFYVFDGASGDELLRVDRTSGTLIEYPVVADVDNDGSAEAVVVTNYNLDADHVPFQTAPTLQVVRDVQDRWVPARRIWNQHTYHVTNIREDGTVPQYEPPSWKDLNTFRTQAQILSGGGVCVPEPEG